MTAFADLEIGLHRWSADSYAVDLRFSRPNDEGDVQEAQDGVHLDVDGLRGLALDPGAGVDAYGRRLGAGFFGIDTVRRMFDQALAVDAPLRLRLVIGPSAPELHGLLWETLPHPADLDGAAGLATSERILLSRFLSSQDWRRVQLRRKDELRALVVVANPSDVHRFRSGDQPDDPPLAPIDVAGELERARRGLEPLPVATLGSGGTATLHNVLDGLRDGPDILYLVCHGAVVDGEPKLWLETEDGTADVVNGSRLVAGLRGLEQQPRLVVLASCQSAGAAPGTRGDDRGALVALGPRLAELGIPAVLAMRGDVSTETVAAFVPRFFAELRRSGQVDRAVAVARRAVGERPDAWMPVLFTRLRTGRIWYVPGFVTRPDEPTFDGWPALVNNIDEGTCTVILGSGLLEPVVGSPQEIARRWAEEYKFPMALSDRADLPQVAQFLGTQNDDRFLRTTLIRSLREEVLRRFGDGLPPDLRRPDAPLDDLMTAVGNLLRQRDPREAHNVLAHLPFPIYVTTNPDSLLTNALAAVGRPARQEVFQWRRDERPLAADAVPPARPSRRHPLVYHLFGDILEPRSLVLTEDNYFDYLIGATRNTDLIPAVVRRALTDSALLFLGFQMTDWDFRVLFRSIVRQEGGAGREDFAHVAVQIDPEDDRVQDTERARRYLKKYFAKAGIGADINIYWGSSADFVRELQENWFTQYGGYPAWGTDARPAPAPEFALA